MIDEELSAALAAYRDAWEQCKKQPPHRPGEMPTPEDLFLANFGTERGQSFLPTIHALHAEAQRVPDPGGPLGNYSNALATWADTHPEVDRQVLHRLIRELLWAAK
ncbi:hypothetical protein [Pseudarthrobacter sp. NamE5]|uniref:hypothetical protein n=1 Tax=Pseudarthrobacter sp. NamE5 TaxID=2576839 RepID=UPI00110B823E|nr:hypothetical protein [Pseudarthrobacter sp. NamE5]TLM87657.1 hypothetical protein FDW84_03450 [Pseudarthrobacter sp. NamE5]